MAMQQPIGSTLTVGPTKESAWEGGFLADRNDSVGESDTFKLRSETVRVSTGESDIILIRSNHGFLRR